MFFFLILLEIILKSLKLNAEQIINSVKELDFSCFTPTQLQGVRDTLPSDEEVCIIFLPKFNDHVKLFLLFYFTPFH
jgi:hypothetical protein